MEGSFAKGLLTNTAVVCGDSHAKPASSCALTLRKRRGRTLQGRKDSVEQAVVTEPRSLLDRTVPSDLPGKKQGTG